MSYLYVCEQGAIIGYEANRFQVKYKNDLLKSVPAETLEMIEVFGNIQMTTQCMAECLKKGVSVIHDNRMLAERAFYCLLFCEWGILWSLDFNESCECRKTEKTGGNVRRVEVKFSQKND